MLISSFIGSRENNFNLLRFIAAVLVLYSQSYPLTGSGGGVVETFLGMSFGAIAVEVFFISSGFLIAHSFISRKNNKTFYYQDFLEYILGCLLL